MPHKATEFMVTNGTLLAAQGQGSLRKDNRSLLGVIIFSNLIVPMFREEIYSLSCAEYSTAKLFYEKVSVPQIVKDAD